MIFAVLTFNAAAAHSQTFTTLYRFTGGSDGGNPYPGLIQDAAGNLYGNTFYGGDLNCAPGGCGVIFKVNSTGKETVVHAFSGSDGAWQPLTPLVRNKAGDLYGTAENGGFGAIFKIDTAGNETLLYSFNDGSGGCSPVQGLVRGESDTLLGTTAECGSSQYGTIFRFDSSGSFTVLHSFAGSPSDGASPSYGHLTSDKFGNLYGITQYGGSSKECAPTGCGALYKLSKKGRLTLLYSFAGGTSDGCYPFGTVVQDKAGNLYGTAFSCGSNNDGTIWKVSRKGKEVVLHNFVGGRSDGCNPNAGVARDSKGNLYGITNQCGAENYGTLYKLSAKGKLTLLHSFDFSDGAYPFGEVLSTDNGAIFGTTYQGGVGPGWSGTVWSYVP
jgi:uncharacterized repeat protein (TIGR03803 family)